MEQPLFRGCSFFIMFFLLLYNNMQILCNFAELKILRRWAALIL